MYVCRRYVHFYYFWVVYYYTQLIMRDLRIIKKLLISFTENLEFFQGVGKFKVYSRDGVLYYYCTI